MKLIDFINLSLKKIFRNKKNIFLIILYIISAFILLTGLAFRDNFSNYIYNTITKNIGFRSLLVSYNHDYNDGGISKLENIENVVEVYSSNHDFISVNSSFSSSIYDGAIDLNYGSKSTLPQKIIGKSFNDNDTKVAICPINFYPSSSAANLGIEEKNIINGYDLLDTTFEIIYYSYKLVDNQIQEKDEYREKFTIIGLYDSSEVMNPNNTCYISPLDTKRIKNYTTINSNNNEERKFGFIVVVNENQNVDTVAAKLVELGFDPSVKNQLDTSISSLILRSCNILISIIMFATILLTIFFINKKMIYSLKEIGILKINGFNKNNINIKFLIENFILNFFSYIIGCLFFILLFFILKSTILKTLIYSGFSINLYITNFIFVFFIIVIIPACVCIVKISKLSKKNIVQLIRGESYDY